MRSVHLLRTRLAEWAVRASPATSTELRTVLSVPGQVNPSECRLLLRLSADAVDGDSGRASGTVERSPIVEIGSYRGRSTVALALGAMSASSPGDPPPRVVAVDPHAPATGVLGGRYGPADSRALVENVRRCGVEHVVEHVRLPSPEAAADWSDPIALLWIDGDHTLAGVTADFVAWAPFVIDEGRIALHDAVRPGLGPTRLVQLLTGETDHLGAAAMQPTLTDDRRHSDRMLTPARTRSTPFDAAPADDAEPPAGVPSLLEHAARYVVTDRVGDVVVLRRRLSSFGSGRRNARRP